MRLYAKSAVIPGGGFGFVFTGVRDGGGAMPGAFEVDFPSAIGQLAHGFTRSPIQLATATDDAQLLLGEPILLPTASPVGRGQFLTVRSDGLFQARSAGADEGLNAISLETTTAAGSALAIPFAQTLRDPRLAAISTADPAPGAAFTLCPEMETDVSVKAGITVALFGFLQVSLPPGSLVECALFLRQPGGMTFAEVGSFARRRAKNGSGNADAIEVPIPLGEVLPGSTMAATGTARLQLHWRAVSGSPVAVSTLRSFGASSLG